MATIELNRVHGDYGFEITDESGQVAKFDNSPDHGGTNFGIRPMQALLMALASCSAIDVISILKKKRQELTNLRISVHGHREEGKVPSLWEKIHVTFYLSGTIEADKAQHAVSLSIDKYCSVAETLRRAGAQISWEIKIN